MCVLIGEVWSWGDSDFGKLGTGTTESCKVPKVIPGLKDVAHIKCGAQFSVALTKTGEVYTWLVTYTDRFCCRLSCGAVALFVFMNGVFKLCLSYSKCIYVLFMCCSCVSISRGSSNYHHLGHGDDEHQRTPKRVAGLSGEKVAMIAVGAHHVLTLCESGNVYGWGKNSSEEVDESGEGVSLPKLLPEASNCGAMHISCGANEVRSVKMLSHWESTCFCFLFFCAIYASDSLVGLFFFLLYILEFCLLQTSSCILGEETSLLPGHLSCHL